ncbi:MAG TPA: sulfotransferase [Acidimicrobiia bacterium]
MRDLRNSGNRPGIIYIMGASRSGSTILGVLLDQAEGTFFAGELCDWPERKGETTVPQSIGVWSRIRSRVGPIPDEAMGYKKLYEHPGGLIRARSGKPSRRRYEELTKSVVLAIRDETGCDSVVDSSHYPLRARTLRRLFGNESVRLIFIVRRPSSVARSFRSTGDKGWFRLNAYLSAVAVLSWMVYLTHPREHRVRIGFEELTNSPFRVGAEVLGREMLDVDINNLVPSQAFTGNRLLRSDEPIRLRPTSDATVDSIPDRVTDIVQWPYRIPSFPSGRTKPSIRLRR